MDIDEMTRKEKVALFLINTMHELEQIGLVKMPDWLRITDKGIKGAKELKRRGFEVTNEERLGFVIWIKSLTGEDIDEIIHGG